jgi:hypothetical protein
MLRIDRFDQRPVRRVLAHVIAPALDPLGVVLYLGDFDLCGNQIEENTWRVLERICSASQCGRLGRDGFGLFNLCLIHLPRAQPNIASAVLGGLHPFGVRFPRRLPLIEGLLDPFVKQGHPLPASVRKA